MARFATIAAGMALMVAQPVTTAWAQSNDSVSTQSSDRGHEGGVSGFFRGRQDRVFLALGALAAVVLGLATISKGHHNNDPRPTSP